jgi:nucleoside-diphosphate-sugar epimerase
VLTQALSGANEIKIGNASPKRDLTFVSDTARAFLLAAVAKNIEGQTIHFGQESAMSMGELTKLCLRVVGSSAKVTLVSSRIRPEQSEVGLLLCDAAKAKKLLGWQPTVLLEEGLRQTADYLRPRLKDYPVNDYVI